MFNRATLQAAFDLLEHLQGQGVKAAIAGGCARDLFFGVRPKDADIIVTGTTMERVHAILEESNVACDVYYRYNDTTSDRMAGCFKLHGIEVDVVVYQCSEITEAIEGFDFNINQFIISGAHRGIEQATARYLGAPSWDTLVVIRDDASLPRILKVQEKFNALYPSRVSMKLGVSEVLLKDRLNVI